MIAVGIHLNDREVRRGLKRMARHGANLSPVLRGLGRPLRSDLKERARRGEGADGPWPKRATSTRHRDKSGKSVGGKKPRTFKRRRKRYLLGRLPTSISTRASRAELRAESKVPWSGVHQEGGVVGRGAKVPARPFVWLSESFLDRADDAIVDFVVRGGWERGR